MEFDRFVRPLPEFVHNWLFTEVEKVFHVTVA
jgi:hypothetical protein